MKTCCFLGYSTFNLKNEKTDYAILKDTIIQVIQHLYREGYYNYLCGFDLGADLLFAECIIEMKRNNSMLILESVLPYETQAINWPESERERYYNLLSKCDKENMLNTHYREGCIEERNNFMIHRSDIIIAVFNGKLSQTMKAINSAKKLSKTIIYINPQDYDVQQIHPYYSNFSK